MRVVVADKLDAIGVRGLEDAGFEVSHVPSLQGDALSEHLAETRADVLVVRSTKVTRAMLEAGMLSLVVRAGAGTNTIDVAAASELGIWVANTPGKNAVAVAELAFGLMLAVDRHVVDGAADLRRKVWNKGAYARGRGLAGRTLGILGMGAIGREVAVRGRAFGMHVVAWSRSLTSERAQELSITRAESAVDVASVADFLSVHLALHDETRGLVDRALFEAMREGSVFVNTSRAEVVDEDALIAAAASGRVRAGLDVCADEPAGSTGTLTTSLFDAPGIIGSHHIGASTSQAQEATALEVVRVVEAYRKNGRPLHVVNLAEKSPATHAIVVRHLDRVGVLAAVLDALKEDGRSVKEMENVAFAGGQTAVARIHVDGAPTGEALAAIREKTPSIIDAQVIAL